MAYSKQQWNDGDIITAEKLNHMEDGIDGAGFNESNLPVAESLGSGDKLRIVTSEGESKQIGADSVGEVIVIGTARDGASDNTAKAWNSAITTDLSMLQGKRPLYVFPIIRAEEGGQARAGQIAPNNLYAIAMSGLGDFDLVADYDNANYFEGNKSVYFEGTWTPLGAGGYTLTLYAVVLA